MAFTPRAQSGTLFDNDRKQNDRQPDMRGNAMVNGKLVAISAWWKDGSRGKFLSLAFSEPRTEQEQGESRRPTPRPQPKQATEPPYDEGQQQFKEDDIPF